MRNVTCGFKVKCEGFFEKAFGVNVRVDVYFPGIWNLRGGEEQMDMIIEKGSLQYLNDCEEALLDSELGRQYFSNEGAVKNAILEGLEQGTLYIALIKNDCAGFFYYIPKGLYCKGTKGNFIKQAVTPSVAQMDVQKPTTALYQKLNRGSIQC